MTPDWMQQAADAAAAQSPTEPLAVPDVVPGRVLDVDGDLLCYWAGGNDDTSVGQSRANALRKIEFMRAQSGCESVVVHMSAASCTKGDRRIIATVKPYQGQRKSDRRPKNWAYLRDFFEGYEGPLFRVKVWATREADDGIAYMAYHADTDNGETPNRVIATGDKDLRMLPGWHIDWQTAELVEVPMGAFEVYNKDRSKLYGTKWFWVQMLQGDTADNIPGLPKLDGKPVGPVRAEKLLAGALGDDAAYVLVSNSYAFEYGDEWQDRLVEQAMLLWLRTDRAAHTHNFMQVVPEVFRSELWPATHKVTQRIKEAYEQAESLGSCGVQSDAAG
jgi:DNA polymerase-1